MSQLTADKAIDKGVHMSNLSRLELALPGASLPWLDALRKAGADRFASVGFPTTRQEEWRFTNFAPLAKIEFAAPDSTVDAVARQLIDESSFGSEALVEMIFVNGRHVPSLSRMGKLPRGATVKSLAQVLRDNPALIESHIGLCANMMGNPLVALNTGSISDGVVIHLARGTKIQGAIHTMFVSTAGATPTLSQPRMLIVAEDNTELNVVKSFIGGAGTHWTNVVTELIAGKDCRISHNRFDHASDDAFRTAAFEARLGSRSRLISHCATLGGRLTRNDLNVVLQGEGADCTLNGMVVVRGSQHCDNHTLLDHAAPNCNSHELYKHVLSDRSTCVFKGKILVRQAAQKTDSKQSSKSLLLSDDARMDSQPELEIYADDVKCTHGSTTGPVDEEMVFYLRSRGVSLDAARHLLTYAFAADITRRIKVEPLRRRLEDFMAAQHGLPRDLRITDLGEHDEKAR